MCEEHGEKKNPKKPKSVVKVEYDQDAEMINNILLSSVITHTIANVGTTKTPIEIEKEGEEVEPPTNVLTNVDECCIINFKYLW